MLRCTSHPSRVAAANGRRASCTAFGIVASARALRHAASRHAGAPSTVHTSMRRCKGRTALAVMAFKEGEEVKDFRVKQMMSRARSYYAGLWSHGDLELAPQLLDPQVVHRDNVWSGSAGAAAGPSMVVGPSAVAQLVRETRERYPDLQFEIQQVGVSDGQTIFVQWRGHGTNLSAQQGDVPSYHESHFSGISLLTFCRDRSLITEVSVFRQPTAEERRVWAAGPQSTNEIKLARLHWEPQQQQGRNQDKAAAGASSSSSSNGNGNGLHTPPGRHHVGGAYAAGNFPTLQRPQ